MDLGTRINAILSQQEFDADYAVEWMRRHYWEISANSFDADGEPATAAAMFAGHMGQEAAWLNRQGECLLPALLDAAALATTMGPL